MSLLAPLWLLLGAAAAVPLLVHLLRRRSGVRVEFPAARYLQRAEREHSRSLRMRNMLLMLLRVLLVLLIALAAARPAAPLPGGVGAGHPPTALAIVMDNSISTSAVDAGRPVLDRLRDHAREVVGRAGPADRVWIVTADSRVHGGTAAAASEVLESIVPLPAAGDPPAALRRGAATVVSAAGDLAPRVLLLTDGQASTWRASVAVEPRVPVRIVAPAGAPPANAGVTAAVPRPARWTSTGAVEVRVEGSDSVPFRITAATAQRSARTVARGIAGSGKPVSVRIGTLDTGWVVGQVQIEPDEMAGDDSRHLAVHVGGVPAVRALPGAGIFVGNAVAAVRGTGALEEGDAIRLVAADELGEWRGPALILPPAAASGLGAGNAALARRGIPWRLRGAAEGGALRGPGIPTGATARIAHELIATAPVPADTLVTVEGRPWAVGGVVDGVRYVLVASPLVPEATDVTVRAGFVPWLAALVTERLAGAEGEVIHVRPGATVPRPVWADSLDDRTGSVVALAGETVAAPGMPGVYLLRRAGLAVGALVVNVEENESLLDRLTPDVLATRVQGTDVHVAALDTAPPERAYATAGTRSLLPAVLIVALLLLVVEGLVGAAGARGAA